MSNINKVLKPWPRRLFLKKISWLIIIITSVLSLTVIGLSVYGTNIGNFVVNVEEGTQTALTLSETGVFEKDSSAVLYAKGLGEFRDTTFGTLPTDLSLHSGGSHNSKDNTYIAYTFYLKNTARYAEAYSMKVNIKQDYLGVSYACRFMIFTNGERTIYAHRDASGNIIDYTNDDRLDVKYTTEPFVSDVLICNVKNPSIEPNQIVKYTFVFWLEGWDEDCTDDIKGGAMQLDMNFEVIK
ncbi:MAG: hypothetical protein RR086_04850 [Clostridia bacterium]